MGVAVAAAMPIPLVAIERASRQTFFELACAVDLGDFLANAALVSVLFMGVLVAQERAAAVISRRSEQFGGLLYWSIRGAGGLAASWAGWYTLLFQLLRYG